MTYRENIEGLDASILMHPKVWQASGHVENFTDPMIDCRQCKARFRVDILADSLNEKKKKKALEGLKEKILNNAHFHINMNLLLKKQKRIILEGSNEIDELFDRLIEDNELGIELLAELNCPQCGNKGTFTAARQFNLMFKTFIGSIEDPNAVVYLRPETAQGIFVNFLNVQGSSRQKLPFGIAQIGKAFRNEINTKNFLFRTREFEQMEMQFFVKPAEDKEWYEYWKAERMKWFYQSWND